MTIRRSKQSLLIGEGKFSLPIEAVTESIGILAKRRAGKSTTARRLTEQFSKAKQQVVIVDPKGDWWGLLYARDGKKPGLPFIVLGGGHGHIDLEPQAGEVVARLVVEERVNVIIDLSNFRKDVVPAFMTPFLETVYRLKAQEQYRTPMMLIIDEADAIAPQKPDRTGERLMASAVEDIVRRGGQRGMGCMMITQRAAVLSKNVLTQIGILIILRTIAPQDLKVMDTWIAAHGTPLERAAVRESLPTMAPGEAFVWAPGWPSGHGIFQRVQMLLPETFDSSSTPRAGYKVRPPKHAARVNLGALQTRMAATIAHQKENDPSELKSRLSEQTSAILKLQRDNAALKTERDQLAAAVTGREWRKHSRLLERVRRQIRVAHGRIVEQINRLQVRGQQDRAAWSTIFTSLDHYAALVRSADDYRAPRPTSVTIHPQTAKPAAKTALMGVAAHVARQIHDIHTGAAAPPADDGKIGAGELATLRAIAMAGSMSREYVTLLTGYRKSTRNQYIQRLEKRGFVSVRDDAVVALQAGLDAAGPVEKLPAGAELVDWWLKRLPSGEAKIFRLVVDGVSDRDELSAQTGLKKSSRNQYLQRLGTRGLVQIDADDRVRPHEMLKGGI